MPFDLSEEQLLATEREVGATFPASYRDRMKRSNGGAVKAGGDVWELIPIRDLSDRKRLSRTTNHVILETRSYSEFRAWHENAYAIGQNGSGDALVMFRDAPKFEAAVFIWRHDDGALETVATDFSELHDA